MNINGLIEFQIFKAQQADGTVKGGSFTPPV
jgi:hypothetical protein